MMNTTTPHRVLTWLLVCIGLLSVGHLAVIFARHGLGFDYLFGLNALFDINDEQNVPTLFSSLMLLGAGGLLFVSARLANRLRLFWYGLAIGFVILAICETAAVHEPLLFVMRGKVSPGTAQLAKNLTFRFANYRPQLALLGVGLALAIWLFLRSIDWRTRWLFVLAGVLYLGGAMGVDELTAAAHGTGRPQWFNTLCTTCEEVLEMGGAATFIFALLDRLARLHPGIGVRLVPEDVRGTG